ncbi:hypothetical protein G6F35_012839 [Rhizopus arrhizus]|nr:hypothetical protein G6F35_012839 [Rhizopus arrhizus]
MSRVDDRTRRQQVLRRQVGARDRQVVALGVDDAHDRAQVLGLGTTTLRIGDFARSEAGQLVGLLDNGDAVDEVDEADEAGHFRHDRVVMRIPVGHGLASLDRITVLGRDGRTVRQLVTLTLTAVGIEHRDFTRARHRHQRAVGVLDRLEVAELDRAGGLDGDVVDRSSSRRRTTDVERTHGQLGTRLTDRLRGDDADRFTDVDQVAAGQIAAVAATADTEGRLARDRRTHLDALHAGVFQLGDPGFVQQGVAGNDRIFVVARQEHVLGHHATQHAILQRLDHVAAFHDRGHDQAFGGTAIHLGDHHVLRDVDQTTDPYGHRGWS